jgi:hypothetical protein
MVFENIFCVGESLRSCLVKFETSEEEEEEKEWSKRNAIYCQM